MRRLRGSIGGGRDDAQPREDRGAHRVPFDLRARSAGAGRARARDGLAPPDCEECRRLETEYGEVGGRLAFALEPVALRPLRRRDDRARDRRAPGSHRRPGAGCGRSSPWRRRWCCSPVAAIVGATVFGGAEVSSEATVLTSNRRIRELTGTITAVHPGRAGSTCRARARPALAGRGLRALADRRRDARRRGLRPAERGRSVFAFADTEAVTDALLAVTVEPSSCSDARRLPRSGSLRSRLLDRRSTTPR